MGYDGLMSRDRTKPALLRHIRGPDDFAAAFDVSRETIARLTTYERLLRQWQKAVNLVAPSTLDDIWHRHFADSAQLLALAPAARTWLDLGSGAGFPGLVVAILLASDLTVPSPLEGEGQGGGDGRTLNVGSPPTPIPSPQGGGEPPHKRGEGTPPPRITLLESNARKCAFLHEVVRHTGILPGIAVDILSTRIEAAATQVSLHGPDVVSARAVASLDKLLGLVAPLSGTGTVGLFLKGRDAAAELEAAERQWEFEVDLVPSRTEPEARVVVIRHLRAKMTAKTKD
jgi:16S rRNA (guanine527-N7)-methyltransferase